MFSHVFYIAVDFSEMRLLIVQMGMPSLAAAAQPRPGKALAGNFCREAKRLSIESRNMMLSPCKFLIEGPPYDHPSNLTCPRTDFVQLRIS